ncbi:MAG TPA: MFS transporter [Geminicoccaceae bacterium]|nr:MFS transporter [Geminicoccus sp.]HMU50924.1 MFS transporter [Geminicoccaceae bacterium]
MSLAQKATRREWVGLAVLSLPTILISMDLTVLYLAVPALAADLAPSGSQMLWIVDIYGFLVAGLLITMGTLGDRIGRRRLLLTGAAAFGCASVLAAFSTSAEMLIVARALLGIAGATLMPSTLSLIRNMFHDDAQRSVAIGVWASSFSVGSVIGPLCGGLLLHYFWWGSVFLLNVPVMLLLLALGPLLLPEYRDPGQGRFDIASAALSIAAMLASIWGTKRLAEHGLAGPPIFSLAAGIGLAWLFVHRQRRLSEPLIDLALFRSRAFGTAVATNMLAVFVCLGAMLLIAQYLQLVLGLSPLVAGLWTVPPSIASIIGAMAAPGLARSIRPAIIVGGGLALCAAGLLLLALADGRYGLEAAVAALIAMFFGISMVMTLCTDLIVAAAPPERAGAASAISETGGELGGALGIAVLGSVALLLYRLAMTDAAAAGLSFTDTLAVARTMPGPSGIELREAANAAFVLSMRLTAALSACLTLSAALAVPVLLHHLPARAQAGPGLPTAAVAADE